MNSYLRWRFWEISCKIWWFFFERGTREGAARAFFFFLFLEKFTAERGFYTRLFTLFQKVNGRALRVHGRAFRSRSKIARARASGLKCTVVHLGCTVVRSVSTVSAQPLFLFFREFRLSKTTKKLPIIYIQISTTYLIQPEVGKVGIASEKPKNCKNSW